MDRDTITISNGQFQLTTSGSDPAQLETVVSELQGVTRSTYGQYCGLSRAAEMVGERWGLLILRDLVVEPKTVGQLHTGLPRIPTTLLSRRLKELEYNGIIRRLDGEDDQERYDLTEYGRALEDVLFALGRWGAMMLGTPRPEDIVTEDSIMVALRATFLPASARDVDATFEVHAGAIVIHVEVDHGKIEVGRGPLPGADAIIKPGPLLRHMMTRDLPVHEALDSGDVEIIGDPGMLATFIEMFQLPKLPAPVPA
ncbi:winged helix-turn-helix transcriptional regulator [Actinophytocola sediminis]